MVEGEVDDKVFDVQYCTTLRHRLELDIVHAHGSFVSGIICATGHGNRVRFNIEGEQSPDLSICNGSIVHLVLGRAWAGSGSGIDEFGRDRVRLRCTCNVLEDLCALCCWRGYGSLEATVAGWVLNIDGESPNLIRSRVRATAWNHKI